jgi:uncharacterized membrane protein required for colicin V production
MNELDYAIVGVTVLGAVFGVSRGVLRMATTAASLVAGIYVAWARHDIAAELVRRQMALSPAVSAAIGYVVVFAIAFEAVQIAGNLALHLLQVVHMSWADRLCGGAVGAGIAGVIAGLSVVMLTALLPPDARILRESKLVPEVLAYNHTLVGFVPPEIRDAYQARRDELMQHWMKRVAEADATARRGATTLQQATGRTVQAPAR